MGFRHRLALFLVATLVIVQALTAFYAYGYMRHSLLDKKQSELVLATQVFTRQLGLLSRGVTDDVNVLSLDFALRAAIAQHDVATAVSALRNHGNRIGATRMMMIGLDGRVEADTRTGGGQGSIYGYPDLLRRALASNEAKALAVVDGRIYWVVVVSVRAPVPIAYFAAYVPVDAKLLETVRQISSIPRSIALVSVNRSGYWAVIASTPGASALVLASHFHAPLDAATLMGANGETYLTVPVRLGTASASAPIVAILGYPMNEALAPFRSLVWPMLIALVVALLVALTGAVVIVRSVSRPLEALASSARRIAAGDYRAPVEIAQKDELGQLSVALIAMTESISEREDALTSAIGVAEHARGDAERANLAKSQFLANMSHELRTPLNAILGFGEMLEHQVLGPIGLPRYAEYARDICTSARHLLGLLSRMLDLAEAESGRLELLRESFAPRGLLKQAAALAERMAQRAQVALVIREDVDASIRIVGDQPKLRQAVAGLVHNAIKFTPAAGRVTISSRVDSGWIVVRIEDTGVGMSEEDIAVVTKPFHRLRSALDGLHQGAGLGLPFAKAVVELHGGTLTIESAQARGTKISIRLPFEAAAEAVAA